MWNEINVNVQISAFRDPCQEDHSIEEAFEGDLETWLARQAHRFHK